MQTGATPEYPLHLTLPDGGRLAFDRPLIVGILNVTPDSFSDGGAFVDAEAAAAHAQQMVREGADVIDIGGESTRPGAVRVDADEQKRRLIPIIQRLQPILGVPMSIDTTRADVAEAALDAGAAIVNDVSAGRDDPRMFRLAAERNAPIILMHMRGEPATMQQNPVYRDVVAEVLDFLLDRSAAAQREGVRPSQIILDPGMGFGKTLEHNVQLLSHLRTFVHAGHPVMLGTSRKSFLSAITGAQTSAERDAATAATTALAVAAGVHLLRVHNVRANRVAADAAWAVAVAGKSQVP